jgi:tol-pal system protein YbgF
MKRRLAACCSRLRCARGALFDDEEARKRIEALRTESNARMEKLEAASRGQIELANQIETLKAEVAKLRGQIEVLTNEIESTQKRQKDFYVDLDNRLRKLEPQAGAEARPTDAKPAADPAAETRDYEAALNLFKAGKHKDALAAFLAFIKAYPASPFLPSAHYWAGSAHYQLGEYKKAVELFSRLAATWPDDAKAPDALLGEANCLQERAMPKGAQDGNACRKIPRQCRRCRRPAAPGSHPPAPEEVTWGPRADDRDSAPMTDLAATLRVTEIFHSLQGESTRAGLPTVFVRLTGCPLRCAWCDTDYAFSGGETMTLGEVLVEVARHGSRQVCVTGGEPLAQKACLPLLTALCDAGYSVR